MYDRWVAWALAHTLKYLLGRVTALPPSSEVRNRMVGYGVVRTSDNTWWLKLQPGDQLTQIGGSGGDGIHRVTTVQRIARPPVPHDLVFDIDLDRMMAFDGTVWGEI